MCGIAGFLELLRRRSAGQGDEIAWRMVATLTHRGPDDGGIWTDAEAGIGLAHRRLAIVDLSAEGHQPMHSPNGRYALAFNGEICNFASLRSLLEQLGHGFRGHSDTEVMLAAFCEWGVQAALERFTGMFAFALWDRAEGTLHLARDRAGEKPLFYGWAGDTLVFGSELKALRAHPRWRGEVDRRALALFVRHGYIPGAHCIYRNVFKLPPGSLLTMRQSHVDARELPESKAYWSLQDVAEAGVARPFEGDAAEAGARLLALLRQSVARQMVADVPLGAFLSGGIDSSLVVALMQGQSRRPIRTFSIGFRQEQFNEAPFAKAVARHLGTDHTELYVEASDLQQVIPELPRIYDEPLADPSQIPTVLLCRLARAHVTVSLSGDAGDELFAGYGHYRKAQRLWGMIRRIPVSARQPLANGLKYVSSIGQHPRAAAGPPRRWLNRFANLADLLPATTDRDLFHALISVNRLTRDCLCDPMQPEPHNGVFSCWDTLPGFLERMLYADFVTYLPDDVLVKVDRAAMSVALETRIPLLDHRIIEFAWSLPASLKQRGRQNKWLLRHLLYQHVPRALVDRPKRGFAAPIGEWLRGPLRDWADHLLNETRLQQEGFFQPGVIRQRWQQHLAGNVDWSVALWHLVTFQAWRDEQNTVLQANEATTAIPRAWAAEAEACRR